MIPAQYTTWPPHEHTLIRDRIDHAKAWLTGDLGYINQQLPTQPQAAKTRWQNNGGIGGATARLIYGRPHPERGNATIQRFLPLPASMCQTSADLLLGQPATFTLHPDDGDNEPAAEALQTVFGSDLAAAELTNAAQQVAAYGWVMCRVVWDTTHTAKPWLEFIDPSQTLITWRGNRPTAVTMWDVLPQHGNAKTVHRLFQHHSVGHIAYALFAGKADNIGQQVPFTDHPDAAHLADLVDADGAIPTGSTRLTAYPWLNRAGVAEWDNYPQLRHLGTGDIAAGGKIWADINLLWTDMVNEFGVGKAKLLVSEELLNTRQPGSGLAYDMGQTVYPVAQGASADERPTLEQVQFAIRVEEYRAGLQAAKLEAADAVGWSPITLGLDMDARAITATEITARSAKTLATWQSKARMARAALSEIATALLEVDAYLNNTTPPTKPVNVALVAPIQETEEDKANRLTRLHGGMLASTEYAVAELHPEWTEQQKAEEVARIRQQALADVPDPFTLPPDAPMEP